MHYALFSYIELDYSKSFIYIVTGIASGSFCYTIHVDLCMEYTLEPFGRIHYSGSLL